jgi:predicted PurR-regulated permease PerM
MSSVAQPDYELRQQAPMQPMDVLIRAVLLGGLAFLCYRVFSPFLTLTVWSIILAVTLYPLHQRLARIVGGKQWLASTILVVLGALAVVVPTALLVNSFADSVRGFVGAVQNNTLAVPAPRAGVETWPLVGKKIYGLWAQAHADLPALVQSLRPKLSELAGSALAAVARVGGSLLMFLASFVISGIIMAYGESGARSVLAIFRRAAGPTRGESLSKLSTATIRAVALGVIGIAFIQAILIGLALLLAGVPAPGVLALIALVLGIVQIPGLVITLPAIIYIWSSGDYSTGAAVTYTIVLLLTGMADNFLKPLMLGRGVDAPMPVILFGALGGMAGGGVLGMFVGATALALGYQIFMSWVASPDSLVTTSPAEPTK